MASRTKATLARKIITTSSSESKHLVGLVHVVAGGDWDGGSAIPALIRGPQRLPHLALASSTSSNGRLRLVAQAEDAGRTREDRYGEVRLEANLQHLALHSLTLCAGECNRLPGVEHHPVAGFQGPSWKVIIRPALGIEDLHQVVGGHLQGRSARVQVDDLRRFADLRGLGHCQDGGIISGHDLGSLLEVPAHQEEVRAVAPRLEDGVQHEAVRLHGVRLHREPGRVAQQRGACAIVLRLHEAVSQPLGKIELLAAGSCLVECWAPEVVGVLLPFLSRELVLQPTKALLVHADLFSQILHELQLRLRFGKLMLELLAAALEHRLLLLELQLGLAPGLFCRSGLGICLRAALLVALALLLQSLHLQLLLGGAGLRPRQKLLGLGMLGSFCIHVLRKLFAVLLALAVLLLQLPELLLQLRRRRLRSCRTSCELLALLLALGALTLRSLELRILAGHLRLRRSQAIAQISTLLLLRCVELGFAAPALGGLLLELLPLPRRVLALGRREPLRELPAAIVDEGTLPVTGRPLLSLRS